MQGHQKTKLCQVGVLATSGAGLSADVQARAKEKCGGGAGFRKGNNGREQAAATKSAIIRGTRSGAVVSEWRGSRQVGVLNASGDDVELPTGSERRQVFLRRVYSSSSAGIGKLDEIEARVVNDRFV